MPLKYTGRSKVFEFEGRKYAHPSVYDPAVHDATFDSPIRGLTQERALRMIERSNLHSFEDASGDDLEEKTTAPATVVDVGGMVAPPAKGTK